MMARAYKMTWIWAGAHGFQVHHRSLMRTYLQLPPRLNMQSAALYSVDTRILYTLRSSEVAESRTELAAQDYVGLRLCVNDVARL